MSLIWGFDSEEINKKDALKNYNHTFTVEKEVQHTKVLHVSSTNSSFISTYG